jgi:tetratricopeptide (TPR) repeat protein
MLLSLVLLLAGGAAAGYLIWRPHGPVVPAIATAGMDHEVVAAIADARAGVEARPKSAAAWGRFGMILFAQDMYSDCLAVFAQAERLDPADARWPYFQGLALMFIEPARGIVLLERAARLAPDSLTTKLRLAEEELKLERTDEADALFRELLLDQPSNPRALLGRGLILSRGGRWQESLEPLRAAAAHPTARRAARAGLAEAYSRLGDPKAAEEERRIAAELPPDLKWPDDYLAQARQYRTGLEPRVLDALEMGEQGQVDEGLALSTEVVRDHPDSDEAHLTRAKLLIRAGRPEEAEGELRQALKLNSDLVGGHFLLGAVLAQRGDFAGGERGFLRAVALKPAHGLAHQNLGTCRLRLGKRSEALTSFREAVRCRPDLPVAHLELGALLLEDGRAAEAVAHLEQAERLDGKNERVRSLLAEARTKAKP